jgi:hypothetical protein
MSKHVTFIVGLMAASALGSAPCSAQPAAPAPAKAIPVPAVVNGYLKLDFYWLSFYPFVEPNIDHTGPMPAVLPTGEEQIPAAIKSWSGKKATITGFILPTKLENGQATEILLMANLMLCCYGAVPKMNDWIIVKVPKGTPVIQDRPIAFKGTFKVGAVFQDNYLTAIYEMDAEGPGVLQDD